MKPRLIRGLSRPSLLLVAFAALLITAACSNLRDAIGGDGSTPTPEATSPAEGNAALDSTSSASAALATRYIGNTGGLGVSLRSDCATDARIASGWAETTEVRLLELGEGRCLGWSLAEAQGVTSWVSQLYLVSERPAAAAAPATVPSIVSAPAPPPADSGQTATASPSPGATATSLPGTSPVPPMFLYGPAAQYDSVLILVDGQPCITVDPVPEPAAVTGYLWSTQLLLGQCDAHQGSVITFTLNGAPTNEQLQWSAGGMPPNPTAGISLTPA